MRLAPGAMLGRYQVEAPLGSGGMGEVYRGRDTRLGRAVAIKVLPELFAADAGRIARFEREARAAGLLNHPNILTVYDVGSEEGCAYLVYSAEVIGSPRVSPDGDLIAFIEVPEPGSDMAPLRFITVIDRHG
jgi:serine/threonine protein kinase